ncbi:hypothetical protein J2S50_005739 [Streptomyces sp. DSM 40167]|nr:hypothetical protein [Streptomyces sp. DSM 40167]
MVKQFLRALAPHGARALHAFHSRIAARDRELVRNGSHRTRRCRRYGREI